MRQAPASAAPSGADGRTITGLRRDSGAANSAPRTHPVRHLLIAGVLLIAAIVAVTAILIASFRERALENTERELRNTSLIVAEQLDRSLQALDLVQRSVLDRIAAASIATSADLTRLMTVEDVHDMLADKISGLAQVESVAIVNAEGQIVNGSRQWASLDLNVADRDYFRALEANPSQRSFISDPSRSRSTGQWNFHLARRVTNSEGDFIGLILGSVELGYFEKFFSAISLGTGGSVSLYRDDGTLLVRYPHPHGGIGHRYIAGLRALEGRSEATTRYPGKIDGKDRVLAAHRLGHFPLYVTAARDIDFALAPWYQETKLLVGAGTAIVLIIAAVMLLVGRQMQRNHQWSKQRLALEKQRLDCAVNSMPQGLLLFDAQERMIVCNQRYREMYGISADLARPGCTMRDLIAERRRLGTLKADVDAYCAERQRLIRLGKPFETMFELPDGRWIRVVNHPAGDGGWVSIHEDATARRLLERERDGAREFIDSIVDNVPTPILVKSTADWRYVLANKAGLDYIGLPRDQVIGKTCREIWPETDAERIEASDRVAAIEGFLFSDEHVLNAPGKGARLVTSKRLAIRDANGKSQHLLTVIEDVTERKQSESRIAHLAHHDSLTGLPNRVLFRERLEQALSAVRASGRRVALLYLDLDHFKSVNDSLGHPVGDELLKEVAERLRTCLSEDDFVARLGGDEFAIVRTVFDDLDTVTALAERVLAEVGGIYDVAGHQLLAAASIGIAVAPDNGFNPDELLKNADLAMYGCKGEGRGSYRFFESDMDARIKARRALEFDLREAIMCGGFDLHYQPLISFADGRVTCCEALLRWDHRTRGWVPPSEFIGVAEETGLIGPLGEWVLRTACAEAARWPDGVRLAVNVSPVQFNAGNLVQTVMGALGASQLPAHRLELEITEAVLIRDDAAALTVLHQLRALGVRIALDDFGTGYSSLSYLQRFPFDKIKIDRSFILGIAESDYSRNIVQAIVDIATTRQITTTAEGVETLEQSEALRALGCTEMQGYLFSTPLPADNVARLIADGAPKLAQAS
jgi:diguanylate cyclase (GGDEF)-like protein/PAS domain S-box-containing protein